MSGAPAVYTIPPWCSFADALARGLLADTAGHPERLADTVVLVPTRRAVRALSEAFLRQSAGRPTLLPRLSAIGDVEEDALWLEPADLHEDIALEVPPAIGDLQRRLLLSRLIGAEQKGLKKARQGGTTGHRPLTADQGARLAAELARFLDQVQIERLSFDRLEDLVPDDYAAHWQVVLRFLRLLTRHWPNVLAQHGQIDAATRRNRLLEAQSELWRRSPPPAPVIAAGSTGTVPATADLIKVVAGLPRGAVVLPGLDPNLDDTDWSELPATHPQAAMARLLDHIGVARQAVADWPGAVDATGSPARAALVSAALRPAAGTAAPTGDINRAAAAAALEGVFRVDCATGEEEAGVAALVLREVLDTPGKTAALVTADRVLARRVAAELLRWDVKVDDSAGIPLALTPVGVFLRLTARMAAGDLAPVDLLAVLKHPLAAGGVAPETFRARARELERAVLRGPRPAPGFDGLKRVMRGPRYADLRRWLTQLKAGGAPFVRAVGRRRVRLAKLVDAHVAFAEWLAAGAEQSGAARLWSGETGEAAAHFVAELAAAAAGQPTMAGAEYPALLDALMAGHVVRPRFGGHPRLAIWGPLEARLQQVDRLVLGGLNEGSWPADVRADPWMSRPMRKQFGLPPLERQIGLAAHDFCQAFCAAEVFLTRAERVDGTPTVESRWLSRLDVALSRAGVNPAGLRRAGHLIEWWRQLDRPAAYRPEPRPEPRPPVATRPRSLSVTQIESWLRDPYSIYARHILRLRPLDPIDAEPDAADRGTIIHDALDRFLKAYPAALPDDALDRLLEIGEASFRAFRDRPGVRAFWWPRFERIAGWFIGQEAARRVRVADSRSEVKGRAELTDDIAPFELRATADRIDRFTDGGLAIIDYKTGSVPQVREMRAGLAPQLPLEAVIAAADGFDGVPAAVARELAYWQLGGGAPAGTIRDFDGDPEAAMAAARAGLIALVRRFDDPETPYLPVPRPMAAPRYNDYAHLARVLEWSVGAPVGEP
ncbi:MAG: double-strand break repair protein AddB [Alphaproteobacteria bacterium]|nr:double-strand break repair protein AddB [Alphaproteobacteria bacterium]